MLIKGLTEEDFTNYKKPSMYIAFPHCTFKCEKDCGIKGICQNSLLAKSINLDVDIKTIVEHYINNSITKAIILAGLEPLDSFEDVIELISEFRKVSEDDIIIYTGYTEDECADKIVQLKQFTNIIIKFGRFVPDDESKFDEILGITLVSKNQYAKKIS